MKGIHPAIWLIGAAIYVICPLDGDFIPVAGWIDDVLVVIFSIKKFNEGTRGGPGAPGGMVIAAQDRAAPARPPVDLLVTVKGNPQLN